MNETERAELATEGEPAPAGEPIGAAVAGAEAPQEPPLAAADPEGTVPDTNTAIPPELEAQNAGSDRISRWLEATFGVGLWECQSRFPAAKTLRELVSCLESPVVEAPPDVPAPAHAIEPSENDPSETEP